MNPDHGGRFVLRLRAVEPVAVRYDAELSTSGKSWLREVAVRRSDGRVEWRGTSNTPEDFPAPVVDATRGASDGAEDCPAWIFDAARAALRAAWRQARGTDGSRWPRRIQRWRAASRDEDAAGALPRNNET